MLIQCPRCRTRLQVPDEAAGKTATCANPQCGASFVIPASTSISGGIGERSALVPTPTNSVVSTPDPTEITIQLDTRPRRPSTVTVQAALPSNSMGIASLVVGILALLLCWLPMMNRLGYAIGALGIMLAVCGVVVASQQRGVSIGFPIGGLALSVLGLVLAFQMDKGLQDIQTAVKTALAGEVDAPKGRKSGGAAGKPSQAGKDGPVDPKKWVDATKTLITRGDASIKVKSVRIGDVARLGINGRQEAGPYLLVELRVMNRSETKKIDFTGWSNELDFLGPKCSLVDEHGNNYAHMKVGLADAWEGPVRRETIAPRGTMVDRLIFEPPVDAAKELHLEIPAVPLGGEGCYRFSIPRQMWDGGVQGLP